MGNRNSSNHGKSHPNGRTDSANTHHTATVSPVEPTADPPLPAPAIDADGSASASDIAASSALFSDPALLQTVLRALPPSLRGPRWRLAYDSRVHGCSFAQLCARVAVTAGGVAAGAPTATIVVIREALGPAEDGDGSGSAGVDASSSPGVAFGGASPGTASASSGTGSGDTAHGHTVAHTFGGFCTSPWALVAARERAGRSAAAAKARAAREGHTFSGGRPAGQAAAFFGDAPCGVFTTFRGPRAWASANGSDSNYMYLFDVHPDDASVGIGMGGAAGRPAWFLDSWLDRGRCAAVRCPTFASSPLCPRAAFAVDSVEVWSVDPAVVAEAERLEGTGAGVVVGQGGVLRRPDANADRMLLELHGVHQFRSDPVMPGEEAEPLVVALPHPPCGDG